MRCAASVRIASGPIPRPWLAVERKRSMPTLRKSGSFSSTAWMYPTTRPSTRIVNPSSSGSPSPVRSFSTRARPNVPHHRATDGSARMAASSGASPGSTERRTTCRPCSSMLPSLSDDRRVRRPGYDGPVRLPHPDDLLTDLDPARREAVTITSGPLCILAGAGSGKTRVISRRVAYALATGLIRPRDVLVVTFTDKAAAEMAGRLAALGHRGVAASTFHAAALRQLRHFWPRVHGTGPPEILASKAPVLAPLAAGLPGGYRYLAVRDLAAECEGAKARRMCPGDYEARATTENRDGPLPPDLMAGLYRRYETNKARAGRIDFEDMLERTIGLIEEDESIAVEVRDRYR